LISNLPAAPQPPIADGGWEMMSEKTVLLLRSLLKKSTLINTAQVN
jgi:hypothetical protein